MIWSLVLYNPGYLSRCKWWYSTPIASHSNLKLRLYRSSAVQSVTKGDQEQALQLVREARKIEGKLYQSPTTDRTNEIVAKIMQRKGDKVRQIEKEAKEKEERDRAVLLRKRVVGK